MPHHTHDINTAKKRTVYCAGPEMGAKVRKRLGRKHGSPASNLKPSMP